MPTEGPNPEQHLTRIAEMLLAYPTVILSGERMASELNLSRSTVWQGMEQLRAYGVQLDGHRGKGYQLMAVPDLLLPALLHPLLRRVRWGQPIHHFFRAGSTQQLALEAAQAGGVEGELFVAESQSAGRGRHGNAWESPAGEGIYFSLILRPPGPPAGLLPLTLAAGMAVADAVCEVTGLKPDIRWPNDLLLDGKKFCGVLIEMSAEATRIHHAVLGVGINVHQREFSTELEPIATSLWRHRQSRISRVQLLAAVVRHLETHYRSFVESGTAAIIAEFGRASRYARGLSVTVGRGEDAYAGVTDDLDDAGFLRVRLPDGAVRTIISGDVRER